MGNPTMLVRWRAVSVFLHAAVVTGQCPPGTDPSADHGDAWCDDFESYNLGSIDDLNGWEGWAGDPSVAGSVTDQQNHTPGGEKSLAIDWNQDTVRVFHGYDVDYAPFWKLHGWLFIPSNMTGEAHLAVYDDYFGSGPPGAHEALRLTIELPGPPEFPWITDQWVDIRWQIDLLNRFALLYYQGTFFAGQQWPEDAALNIAAIRLRSVEAEPRFFCDDVMLVESGPDEVPLVNCMTVNYLDNGCAEFSWSVTNQNISADIITFYLNVEAGTGGQICTDISHVVPPTDFTVENCTGWHNGHALFRFTGPAFEPGQEIFGRLTVDSNGDAQTVTDTGLTVPPFSILLHAAKNQSDAVCATGDFSFGPTVGHTEWSLPAVCTTYLPVPSMSTWAKVVLVVVLVGGGTLSVLCRRRSVAA